MKFTTEELLLAAEIGRRALDIAMARTQDMTREEAMAFRSQHEAELVKAALEECERTADIIAMLRQQ